jgi:preprotein translocase subunit Sec61beta
VSIRRITVPAEMTGRELARRRVALGLLTVLPLAFYEAQSHHSNHAIVTGGIAMAFSIAGASIFAALTARPVDERLVLAGYHPRELLFGRLVLLELFGLAVAGLFSVVMALGTGPSELWALIVGVVLVTVASVPFGLAVGSLAPSELEGVLILIGVVGVTLTLESTQTIAKLLPFWGSQRLLEHAIDPSVSVGAAIPVSLLYALAMLALAVSIARRRAPRPVQHGGPVVDRKGPVISR